MYYCCGSCNSRKNNYWPSDEKFGPYIVNPCDYEMAAHLRFTAKTGMVDTKTPHGKLTEELLQLNDAALVQYRLSALLVVNLLSVEIDKLERQQKAIADQLRLGKITQSQHDTEALSINQEIAQARATLQAHTGERPLPPLRKQRMGVVLLPP